MRATLVTFVRGEKGLDLCKCYDKKQSEPLPISD